MWYFDLLTFLKNYGNLIWCLTEFMAVDLDFIFIYFLKNMEV